MKKLIKQKIKYLQGDYSEAIEKENSEKAIEINAQIEVLKELLETKKQLQNEN